MNDESAVFGIATVVTLTILLLAACGKAAVPPDQLLATAKAAYARNDINAAIPALKSVLLAQPNNADARFMLGSIYNRVRDFRSAAKELRAALDLRFAAGGRVAVELARALLHERRFQEIVDDITPMPGFEAPAGASASALRGRALLALGQRDEAVEMAASGAALQENNADVLLLRAMIAAAQGDAQAALQHSSTLVDNHPDFFEGLLFRSDLLRINGDYDATYALYDRMLKSERYYMPVYMARASLSLVTNKHDDAQRDVNDASALVRNDPMIMYTQTLLMIKFGKYRDALNTLDWIGRLVPDYPRPLLALATTHYALGEFRQAEQFMMQHLKARPDDSFAKELAASIRFQLGKSEQAEGIIVPGLTEDQKKSAIPALANIGYYRTREFSRALETLDRASRANARTR